MARANLKAAITKTKGHAYFNIGSGTNNSLNDLCDLVSKKRVYIDSRIEPKFTLADTSKAKKILNWTPEIDVIKWIKENKPA